MRRPAALLRYALAVVLVMAWVVAVLAGAVGHWSPQ